MKLDWDEAGYRLTAGAREWHLLRDLLVEAGYALHRLPAEEFALRLGVTEARLQEVVRDWVTSELSRNVAVEDVELIRASWFEALDFFSDADFDMRTGWSKEEARSLFQQFRSERRALTIARQWG